MRSYWCGSVVGIVIVALSGCSSDTTSTPGSGRSASATRATMGSISNSVDGNVDELMLRVGDLEPGFAGMFRDRSNGQFVIRLTDVSRRDAALAAIHSVFSRIGAPDLAVVRPADFSFRQLADWKSVLYSQSD